MHTLFIILSLISSVYSQTIVDLAASDQRLTTLVQALTDAGLVGVLNGTGPFTVFAPTNDAFSAITVPNNTNTLSNILQYHVLSGQVLSTNLSSGLVAPTIISQSITVQIDNGAPSIYDSMGRKSDVIEADIVATNGVIHIIDTVLLPNGTIADITSNIESLSTLNGALIATNLSSVLAGQGTFTLFAPTDDAVTVFGKSITSQVLLYHVLGAEYLSDNIPDGDTPLATLNSNGDEVTVIKDDSGAVSIRDAIGNVAMVTMANFVSTNGVVHIIDIVLDFRSIVDLAVDTPELSSLVQALTDANLVSVLSGDGPFTVFAPTNDAFDEVAPLPTNITLLSNILTYHVLSGQVLSTDLSSGLVANTLQTESITIQIDNDGGVFIYDSRGLISQVTQADVLGTNGVIHIVDAVLSPGGNVVDIVSNIDSLSLLAAALTEFELIETLQGDGPFTIFAPTNDAITEFGGTIDAQLLLYHVIGTKYLSDDIPTGSTNLTTLNNNGDIITVIKDEDGMVSIKDINGRTGQVTIANTAGINGVIHIIDIVLDSSDGDDNGDWSTMHSFWGGISIGVAFGIITLY
jgi:transforming growth factor-beta-induced protein